MVSTIDLAISIGIFVIFFVFIINGLISYFANYHTQTLVFEQRTIANSVFGLLFSNYGIPSNWQDIGGQPVLPGLMTDLYRTAISVSESNGTQRTNVNIAVSLTLDPGCINKAWNNTVVLYDLNGNYLPFGITNQNFCGSTQYLNTTTLVLNDTFAPNQTKYYYVYYSPDRNVTAISYSFSSTYAKNMTITIYPKERLSALSISKLNALRSLPYSYVTQTIGGYNFYMRILN